jgi:hypothetical protein
VYPDQEEQRIPYEDPKRLLRLWRTAAPATTVTPTPNMKATEKAKMTKKAKTEMIVKTKVIQVKAQMVSTPRRAYFLSALIGA